MTESLHIQTTVLPGGKLDLVCPQLVPGQSVDILITPVPGAESQSQHLGRDGEVPRSIIDILEQAPGHLLFHSAKEVDEYIREERQSWDR